ncbi:MAG: RNA polymerase sigma factor [Actinomycetota bacterium]
MERAAPVAGGARVPSAGAFSDFYRREWHGAVRLAASLTGSVAVGEDMVQEVFQKMYLTWGRADEPAAYLRVAVRNRCRSWHRRRHLERERLPMLVTTDHGPGEPDELDDVVATLPTRQRAVLVLRYWGDLSEAEVARELGCAPGTVKSLASRARQRVLVALAS